MRPALTRSPVYVLTLVGGVVVAIVGWTLATLFDQSITAITAELRDIGLVLPAWMESAPEAVTRGVVVTGIALVHVWLIGHRRFRRLALADGALLAGLATSVATGALLLDVLPPATRSLFDAVPDTVARTAPTSPAVAGLVAVVVMIRQWLPVRVRATGYTGTGLLLTTNLAVTDAPPYLGSASTSASG